MLISLIQLVVHEFGRFSKIIVCQISHTSIHIERSSNGIFSLCWGGHSTFLVVRLRNKKGFRVAGEEKSQQKSSTRCTALGGQVESHFPPPPPSYTLLLPPLCQTKEALTHFYHDKCLNDSFTPLYVLYPFFSFECAILPACAI